MQFQERNIEDQYRRTRSGKILLDKGQNDNVLVENYYEYSDSAQYCHDEVLRKKNKVNSYKDVPQSIEDYNKQDKETQVGKNVTIESQFQQCQDVKKQKFDKNSNRFFARILIKYIKKIYTNHNIQNNKIQISLETLNMIRIYKINIGCSSNQDFKRLLKNPEIAFIGKGFFKNEAIHEIFGSKKLKNIRQAINSLKTVYLLCLDE
ncbi:hypothetical protein pb186bvf_004768 [Paramecium bursaria]